MQDRYYVQRTGDNYLVRELQKPGDTPSSSDTIIRPFGHNGQEDAYTYARSVNAVQHKLDAIHGQWTKHAVLPAMERQHQWRLARSYQFPNAVKIIHEGAFTGWVVNVQFMKRLYGVVRYFVDSDRAAWIESETHFETDVQRAEGWVRATIAGLQAEQEM